jgi:hypothetical protein
MHRIDHWKLADELNAYQIALLIAGYDPSEFALDAYHMWPEEVRAEISPFLNAVQNAARSDKFAFKQANSYDGNSIDWDESLIEIESFTAWLRSRNFNDGFFIAQTEAIGDISNASGEFYAAKLAAAVRAWIEVTTDPKALSGKTPKKALEVWLRKHANEYGLTNKDGNPNELGIEEICKVANWKPSGGASPTPTPVEPLTPASEPMGRRVRPRPST